MTLICSAVKHNQVIKAIMRIKVQTIEKDKISEP